MELQKSLGFRRRNIASGHKPRTFSICTNLSVFNRGADISIVPPESKKGVSSLSTGSFVLGRRGARKTPQGDPTLSQTQQLFFSQVALQQRKSEMRISISNPSGQLSPTSKSHSIINKVDSLEEALVGVSLPFFRLGRLLIKLLQTPPQDPEDGFQATLVPLLKPFEEVEFDPEIMKLLKLTLFLQFFSSQQRSEFASVLLKGLTPLLVIISSFPDETLRRRSLRQLKELKELRLPTPAVLRISGFSSGLKRSVQIATDFISAKLPRLEPMCRKMGELPVEVLASRIVAPIWSDILPPRTKGVPPLTLVFDLEETLVYSRIGSKGRELSLRPFAEELLERASRKYELVAFTDSSQSYADWVLERLDPNGRIRHRLSRQHMQNETQDKFKDLSAIGRSLSSTVIVGNKPENFLLQPANGIKLHSWTGNREDKELRKLLKLLELLASAYPRDIRLALKDTQARLLGGFGQL